jgi:hypothetical protein
MILVLERVWLESWKFHFIMPLLRACSKKRIVSMPQPTVLSSEKDELESLMKLTILSILNSMGLWLSIFYETCDNSTLFFVRN